MTYEEYKQRIEQMGIKYESDFDEKEEEECNSDRCEQKKST